MAQRPQSYANHRRFFPLYHYPLMILLANVGVRGSLAWQNPDFATIWDVIVAVALASGLLSARSMVLTVQNRIIRTEMRLRLAGILPPALKPRVNDLSVKQLISLRFASDAELPELVQRCLAGDLHRSDDIKRSIRQWQPDFLRA
jgi:hypothetical protein